MDQYVGPFDPADGDRHANAAYARRLQRALMLVHGDMDDNVPVSQTLALATALIAANKDFELLIVPNEGHLVPLTSPYAQRRIWDFLVRELIGETPPMGYELAFTKAERTAYGRAMARAAAAGA
jgi:dipeptidyl-peptidase 4